MKACPVLRHYRIAEHPFALLLPPDIIPEAVLEAYAPFQVENETDTPLFTLSVTEDESIFPPVTETLSYIEKGYGTITLFHAARGGVLICLALPGNPSCCLFYSDIENREVIIRLNGNAEEQMYGLNNSVMLAYTFLTASMKTLLVNASVMECNGQGYLFPGRNGLNHFNRMHCLLWLKHIQGCAVLDSDTTVIRIIEGKSYVYSTPWNERELCRCNSRCPLDAVIQLLQSSRNRITPLSQPAAYASLLSAGWSMKWSDRMVDSMHSVLDALTLCTRAFRLECIPGEEAVALCAENLGLAMK